MNAFQKFNQLAEQVTREIIAQLQQGKVFWQKPWTSYGLPKNYSSGRPYEGFNAFYLNYITDKHAYRAPYSLTFRQAQELGGRIRKGEKGTSILYWKLYDCKTVENTRERKLAEEDDRQEKRFVPFLWTVFNIDQVEGVDFQLPTVPVRSGHQIIECCQRVADHYPSPRPRILPGGSQACYAAALDAVQVPEPKRFVSSEAYHATLFHELIHSTGHPARLNRFTGEEKYNRFGDEAYSQEELVAEMGASFLCAFTGIKEQVFQKAVAYLQGWACRLRHDNTMLIYAAAKAFKAASYILSLKAEKQKEASPAGRAAA